MKKQGHTRNRSSPENEIVIAAQSTDPVTSPGIEPGTDERRRESQEAQANLKRRELSTSVTSSTSVISTRSDVTISDDTVIDEADTKEEGRVQRERSETSETITQEGALAMEGEDKTTHLRQMSVVFRQELLNSIQIKTDSRIGMEVVKLANPDMDMVQLLGRSLPHIVPNVILAKREVSVTL